MLIYNIKEIVGADICNAFIRIDTSTGNIIETGSMDTLSGFVPSPDDIDAKGGFALPSFVDSHTHIVYAGSRHGEFLDKINGLSYEEIARRGGGILNSADRLHDTSEDELFAQSMARANEVMLKGTGAIEIKSGYGLTLPDELKMLRVIARIAEASPMVVRATFLGAHAVGRAFAGLIDDYVDHVVNDMIPAVAAEGIANFVDVFCDEGFFTPVHTAKILEAAAKFGMKPKIHANELAVSGGVEVGVKYNALSVDHLERAEDPQLQLLANSKTIATMLPGASFFLGMPYAPAKKALEAGCRVALASDYNPGSSPSGDMRFIWALACIKMKLTPRQALTAITKTAAAAMDLTGNVGIIAPGARANIIITTPLESVSQIPYAYNTPFINHILLAGKVVS